MQAEWLYAHAQGNARLLDMHRLLYEYNLKGTVARPLRLDHAHLICAVQGHVCLINAAVVQLAGGSRCQWHWCN
jgi:hypothetical protein